jgi:hypothetical protein
MKTYRKYIIIILSISSQLLFSQLNDPFLENYNARKRNFPEKAKEFKDIEGSPYLNSNFVDGVFYLKDTLTVKLPLRYNIFTDEMEYQLNGINYAVGNPLSLNKIIFNESVYVYLPFISKGGYFELFELGKCTLIQKKTVNIKPAEGPKPIIAKAIPATFIRKPDVFYFVINDTIVKRIDNLKSIIDALQNQKPKIENYIKQEKIRKIKKENLIKIVKYYNSL